MKPRIPLAIYLLHLVWLLEISFAGSSGQLFFDRSGRFFTEYVRNGYVNYRAIHDQPAELSRLMNMISEFDLSALQNDAQKKAFWINVYNLLVIHSVIKNYPLKSPRDVGGFFDRIKHNIGGEALTLNEIEQKKLLREYEDARLHFALVCAARGCPKLLNTAFRPSRLEEQLNRRAQATLTDDYYIRIDPEAETIIISEIFKWYKKDFTRHKGSIIDYINQYRRQEIPAHYSISYSQYDWSLNDMSVAEQLSELNNLQAYTPSTLLRQGEIEVKQFNNLYTQTAFFNEKGQRRNQDSRDTYFTGITHILYGITPDVNAGIDLIIKSVRSDSQSGSMFSVFKFASNERSRTALSHIAPKFKISPFSRLRNLAFQTALLFPLVSDLDGSESSTAPFLEVDGMQWWTQVFYDIPIDQRSLIYLEAGLLFRFDSPFEDFYTPVKAFLNYYPSSKWTVYLPTEFTPYWNGVTWSAYYGQTGLGLKYYVMSYLELEVLYTNFLIGKSQGAGQTFNFGIRIVK